MPNKFIHINVGGWPEIFEFKLGYRNISQSSNIKLPTVRESEDWLVSNMRLNNREFSFETRASSFLSSCPLSYEPGAERKADQTKQPEARLS